MRGEQNQVNRVRVAVNFFDTLGIRTPNPEPGTPKVEPNVNTNRELSTEKRELQVPVHACPALPSSRYHPKR